MIFHGNSGLNLEIRKVIIEFVSLFIELEEILELYKTDIAFGNLSDETSM